MSFVRFGLRLAAVVSLLGGVPACSLALVSDEVQCKTDADCTARGGEFVGKVCADAVCVEPQDPKWGCIGEVAPLQPGGMDTLTTQLLDLITNKPPKDLTIKLCNKFDTPCASPLGNPTMDVDGFVTVTLPSDLEAYMEVQGAGYYPMLAFLDHSVQSENAIVFVVPEAVAGALAATAGVQIDDTKGIVLARLADCTGFPTAGAAVTIFPSMGETRFYTINNAVKADATKTDSSGNAGFVNVTPGNPQLTGEISPGGQVYGTTSTLVRAGHITAQIVRPTPEQ
jgi:hypothetical protein